MYLFACLTMILFFMLFGHEIRCQYGLSKRRPALAVAGGIAVAFIWCFGLDWMGDDAAIRKSMLLAGTTLFLGLMSAIHLERHWDQLSKERNNDRA